MTPGRREERSYPLTERQIKTLAQNGLVVTLFLSLSAFLFGLGIDIHKDLDLNPGLAAETKATWVAYRIAAFAGAALSLVVGLMLTASGFNQIEEIKEQTSHEDGLAPYVRKRYPSLLIFAGLLAIFFFAGAIFGPNLGSQIWPKTQAAGSTDSFK